LDFLGILPYAVGALLVLAVVSIVLLKRRPVPEPKQVDLRIDVNALTPTAPPKTGPRLEIRHVPVRLAVLVFAPVGRGKQLTGDPKVLADAIVPGLSECLESHGTRVFRWPPQLSSQGFVQAFMGNVPLPGNRGVGSIWSAAAGKCEGEEGAFLAGMLLSADRSNSLGQFTLNGSHEWLDLLRLRDEA
jgi:hypothetical protein